MSAPSRPDGPTTHAPPVLSGANIGKRYRLYRRPADRVLDALLPSWARRPRQRDEAADGRDFWALRHVDLAIAPGQALGILGRNGSGKSTLLQILAGTMRASEGTLERRGRVVALLELGSGFNPDFTGRENVLLHGSILGISRRDMLARMPEIEAFSEIGPFLDRPVREYSSGMHARLAFSAAMSVRPDLLILDEVLAVGDIGFQHKCLARLKRLREEGLALILVHHWPDVIKGLCQRALVLDAGRVLAHDEAEHAVDAYLAHVREQENQRLAQASANTAPTISATTTHTPPTTIADHDATSASDHASASPMPSPALPGPQDWADRRYGSGQARFAEASVLAADQRPVREVRFGEIVHLDLEIVAREGVRDLSVSFLVRDASGIDVMGTTTADERVRVGELSAGGRRRVRFSWRSRLRSGGYGVCIALLGRPANHEDDTPPLLLDQIDAAAWFAIPWQDDRPIHYKFHEDVAIEVSDPTADGGRPGAHAAPTIIPS